MRHCSSVASWSAVILVALAAFNGPLSAQDIIRPAPSTFNSPVLYIDTRTDPAPLNESLRRAMSPTSKGLLLGGGIGLAASALAVFLYVEGTDPGNYTGAVPIVIGGTALGAVIGAAIGAGVERSVEPRGENEQRATPVSAPDRNR